MAIINQRILGDTELETTVEVVFFSDSSETLATLLDLSTLKYAVGPVYRADVTKIFYSVAADIKGASLATEQTNGLVALAWDNGQMFPDIFIALGPGQGTITEHFKATDTTIDSGNIIVYCDTYTFATLRVTIRKKKPGFSW